LAAFRYGREDLDVLGLTFRKDLYIVSTCTVESNYINFFFLKYFARESSAYQSYMQYSKN